MSEYTWKHLPEVGPAFLFPFPILKQNGFQRNSVIPLINMRESRIESRSTPEQKLQFQPEPQIPRGGTVFATNTSMTAATQRKNSILLTAKMFAAYPNSKSVWHWRARRIGPNSPSGNMQRRVAPPCGITLRFFL
jgi:hypothetical protein